MDAATPVAALCGASCLNAGLDAWLVRGPSGPAGAATATAVASGVSAASLAAALARRCPDRRLPAPSRSHVLAVATSGSVLVVRTVATVACLNTAAVLAARLGPSQGAAHAIAFQLWLSVSLLSDAIAVAFQSLLAERIARRKDPSPVFLRAYSACAAAALLNAAALAAFGTSLPRLFSRDAPTLSRPR